MNVVECIPYRTFKERIKIVKEELSKGRYVEVWDDHIYSARKWGRLNNECDRKSSQRVS